jgi:hypothetical protein
MNVIGIVQTDLNEFHILFEDPSPRNGGEGAGFLASRSSLNRAVRTINRQTCRS